MTQQTQNYMAPGLNAVKSDIGKPPMSMLPGAALVAVAEVLDFGAQKYGRDNWRQGFSYSRLVDAMLRHIYAFQEGEDYDPETGLNHIAHAACCALFLLHYTENAVGTDPGDDRPNTNQSPPPADVLEEVLDSIRMGSRGPGYVERGFGGGYIPPVPFS